MRIKLAALSSVASGAACLLETLTADPLGVILGVSTYPSVLRGSRQFPDDDISGQVIRRCLYLGKCCYRAPGDYHDRAAGNDVAYVRRYVVRAERRTPLIRNSRYSAALFRFIQFSRHVKSRREERRVGCGQ